MEAEIRGRRGRLPGRHPARRAPAKTRAPSSFHQRGNLTRYPASLAHTNRRVVALVERLVVGAELAPILVASIGGLVELRRVLDLVLRHKDEHRAIVMVHTVDDAR